MSPERKERIINRMKKDNNFYISLNEKYGVREVCLTEYKDKEWRRIWNLDLTFDSDIFDFYSDSQIIITIYLDLCKWS